MLKMRSLVKAALAIALIAGIHAPPEASAGLKDRGPVNAVSGFPIWYRDGATQAPYLNGLPLEQCLSTASSPNAPGSPMCVLLPDATYAGGTVGNPGGNFPGESFFFIADGDFRAADPNRLYNPVYRAALESTYATGTPVPGLEMVFMRVRFRMDASVAGTYTITHPYGVKTAVVTTPGPNAINWTEDLPATGLLDGPIFQTIPAGYTIDVSPFLRSSTSPVAVGNELFIGDPNISTTVTGSPTGNNFVRVQDPAGNILFETNLFLVAGKIATLGKLTPPASTAFGTATAGTTSAPKTVQITNTAQRAGQLLTVNGITFTGDAANFALAQSATTPCPSVYPFSLDAGASCNVDVVFTPAAPAGAKTGTLTVNTTDPAAEVKTLNFTGTAVTVTAALSSSIPSPQPAGAAVTFTATATGGAGPFQYRFWLKSGTTWSIVQNYGAKNTWTWNTKGLPAGLYSVQADVRTAGSTVAREASANGLYRLNVAAPATGVTLASAAATPSPQPSGTQIPFTAQGIGGSGIYEYRFWLKTAAGWTEKQPYGPAATWTWDTGGMTPGTYAIQVDVRSAGSTVRSNASRVVSYTLSTPVTVSAGLSANVTTPATVGTPVTFTATAVGGTAPYTYRFWLKTGTTWTQVQAYSATQTWTWAPTAPGTYAIQVDVKAAGSTAARDAAKVTSFTVQ